MRVEEQVAERLSEEAPAQLRGRDFLTLAAESPNGAVAALAQQRREARRGAPPLPPSQREPAPPPVVMTPPVVAPPPVGSDAPPPTPTPPPIAGLPAEPPAAWIRFHPSTLRREWWWARWRETPCWLTSMVTHLSVLLVIGSIAIPPSRHPGAHTWLLAFGAENETLAEADLVIVQWDEEKQEGGDQGAHRTPPRDAAPDDALQAAAMSEPLPVEAAETGPEEKLADHLPPTEPASLDDTRPAEQRPPILLASAVTGASPHAVPDGPPSGGGPSAAWDENRLCDYVVERFIQYDIGRLRGAEGEQARRDFEALGPYAVPALVRGLNRSASIQASCPVVVIAAKLENTLAQSGDYQLVRYAVENIGQEVPANAPHVQRLRALRDALQRTYLDRQEAAHQELATRGVEPSEKLVRHVARLANAKPADLTGAFGSPDPDERLAATIATANAARGLTEGQRLHLASQLLMRLEDNSEAVRAQAEVSLGTLLRVDPADANRGGDRAAFWRTRYAERGGERVERMAAALLSQAMALEQRGRTLPAATRYRAILDDYPGTPAALQAAQRLRNLGG